MTTTPPAPCQPHKADPHHPCAAACAAPCVSAHAAAAPCPSSGLGQDSPAGAAPESTPTDARLVRLRAFMDECDIAWVDIAEELGMSSDYRATVYSMLVNNKTLDRDTREKLLDLGFPEDTLPPERTQRILKTKRNPRFPRRRAGASASQPSASAV